MRLGIAIIVLAVGVLTTPPLHAAPKLLPFQGHLTDAEGQVVDGDAVVVQFKIYDAPVSGAPVWAGEVHKLSVNQGLVNTMLGTKTAFPDRYGPDEGTVMFSKPLYLEITVDAQEEDADGHGVIDAADPPLLPRQVILPAVHAKTADWADTLGQVSVDAIKTDLLENREARNAQNAGPVGKIIALSPLAPAPNPDFWRLCDGATQIPADSQLGAHLSANGESLLTPNLSDERFLLGGQGNTVELGGDNDGHYHAVGNGSRLSSSSDGKHTHRYDRTNITGDNTNNGTARASVNKQLPSIPRNTSEVPGHWHSVSGTIGNFGRRVSGDVAGSNVPKYFKVKYYIKIN